MRNINSAFTQLRQFAFSDMKRNLVGRNGRRVYLLMIFTWAISRGILRTLKDFLVFHTLYKETFCCIIRYEVRGKRELSFFHLLSALMWNFFRPTTAISTRLNMCVKLAHLWRVRFRLYSRLSVSLNHSRWNYVYHNDIHCLWLFTCADLAAEESFSSWCWIYMLWIYFKY